MLRRLSLILLTIGLMGSLAACDASHKFASDAAVSAATYVAGPPASITLITSINGRSGGGAHSALIINGSQRVLYDPAGSWELTDGRAPKRNDLHYGMTPPVLASYIAFQSAGIFQVISQTVDVPLSEADAAIAAAAAHSPAPKAYCSRSVSSILRKLPGFEAVPETFFPKALSRGFAKVAGVIETTILGTEEAGVTAKTN